MNFTLEHHVAPAGHFYHLRIEGLTDTIWKTYPAGPADTWTLAAGRWGTSPENALELLKAEIQKEIKRLQKNDDLRPSQVRRLDILQEALTKI